MAGCTLEKHLARLGLGSRKECRALIRMGLVEIDGELPEDPQALYDSLPPAITVNGETVDTSTKLFVMLHKPAGVECSHQPQHHASVFSLLPERWLAMDLRCVGRLDVDTTGLLLLSNQGDFVHLVESPRKGLGKTYVASLADPLSLEAQEKLRAGVELRQEKGLFRALELEMRDDGKVAITVGEGVYHQVKRMFAAVGNRVEGLHRGSIGTVSLDQGLAPGEWRFLRDEELLALGYGGAQ